MKIKPYLTLLSVLTTAFSILAAVDHEIAIVTKVRGMVMTSYSKKREQSLTSRGQLLFTFGTLFTGGSGIAQVRFIGSGTTVFIPPESEVFFTREGNSESVHINDGKAIIDAAAPAGGSFDAATPVTITTTRTKSVTVVTHDRHSGSSAFFLTDGTAMITDPAFSDWYPFNAPSAMYVRSGIPTVYASALTAEDSTQLRKFIETAHSMKIHSPLAHTLILHPDSGGLVLPGDTMTALQNIAVEIVAVPDPGYVFSRWEVLNGAAIISDAAAESTTVSVATDTRIAARFTSTPATLVIASSGNGITNPENTVTIARNRPLKIVANPEFGHICSKWKVSAGVKAVARDSLSLTVILKGDTGKVTAEFGPRKVICDVRATSGGSVTPGKNAKASYGVPLPLKARARKGYSFINWEITKGRASIADPRSSFTTILCDSGNVSVRARFNRKRNTVRVTVHPHECADIIPCSTFAVPRNESFALSAQLKPGYELRQWVDRTGSARISGLENAVVSTSVDCELFPEIQTRTFNCTVTSMGAGTTSPSGMTKVFYATPATISAQPAEKQKFASWRVTGGDAVIANPRSPTTTVTLSSTDAVIAAQFADEICTLLVDATLGGYVEPADTQIFITGGQLGLKAVPNPQAAFLGWVIEPDSGHFEFSDTITAREQIITCKKTRNAKLTAQFSTQTVELTIMNNGLGVTDPVKKLWVPQEQWMPLTAEPANGNKFLQWVIVSGMNCEIKDQFSLETELNPGTQNVTIKALFDTSSGYPSPEFGAVDSGGEYQLSIISTPEKGIVEPSGPITLRSGVPLLLEAKPMPGYVFEEWVIQQGEAIIDNRYSQSTSVILSQKDAVIECRFEHEKKHVLKIRFIGPDNSRKTIEIPYR